MLQDYSGQNLRGRSFKGQDLTGANFSGADICSCDFRDANLRGANFKDVKAGLQQRWAIFVLAISLFLSILSGYASANTGLTVGNVVTFGNKSAISIGVIIPLMFATFSTVIANKGLEAALGTWILSWAMVGVTVAILSLGWIVAGAMAVALGWAVVSVVAGTFAVTVAGVWALVVALTMAVIWVLFVGASIAIAEIVAVAVIGLTTCISWLALTGDERQAFVRKIAIAFAAFGGTSFRNADLTDADFTGAILKSTDFRNAILTRTCFHQAKMLSFVRPGKTYLSTAQVRQLLVTRQGHNKNFDRQDLRGINLQGANLADASFIGADLSKANLQDADLSRAKLIQTQLGGTDFTGTNLTGAYIEDWGITNSTLFDGVRCEYVYMRLPTIEDPDPLRKPDNREEVFADGEFGDFIKPIVDTLDLYHNQGVDPRAIAISLKQLAENHPEAELRIVGMEVKGEDKFLLRTKTAASADKSELSKEYFEIYNELKALAQQEFLALMAEKDNRILSLETMVVTALQSPKFYSNTQIEKVDNMNPNQGGINQSVSHSELGQGLQAIQGNNNTQTQGDTTVSGDRTINTGGGNYNERIQGDYVQGNYYAANEKQNLTQAAAEIQQLLQQLEQTNPTTTTSEKMTVVAKAVDEIEKNPTLKARVIGALKSGGKEALKESIDHPLVNILIASIEGWQEAE